MCCDGCVCVCVLRPCAVQRGLHKMAQSMEPGLLREMSLESAMSQSESSEEKKDDDFGETAFLFFLLLLSPHCHTNLLPCDCALPRLRGGDHHAESRRAVSSVAKVRQAPTWVPSKRGLLLLIPPSPPLPCRLLPYVVPTALPFPVTGRV